MAMQRSQKIHAYLMSEEAYDAVQALMENKATFLQARDVGWSRVNILPGYQTGYGIVMTMASAELSVKVVPDGRGVRLLATVPNADYHNPEIKAFIRDHANGIGAQSDGSGGTLLIAMSSQIPVYEKACSMFLLADQIRMKAAATHEESARQGEEFYRKANEVREKLEDAIQGLKPSW